MNGKETQAALAAVKPITEPVDWSPQRGTEAFQPLREYVRKAAVAGSGFAHRAIMQGLADSFEVHYLARGMASTLRGVRNAFAERYDAKLAAPAQSTEDGDPTREELIALCLRATPQQSVWSNRDSSAAVMQMGQAWALLSCGCEFTILRDPSGLNSDASTWWVEITFHGFSVFDGMCSDDDIADFVETESFYIPTAARIDARPDRHWY